MKHSYLPAAAALTLLGAGVALAQAPPAPTGKNGATVVKWAEGLGGPQGLVRTPQGEILIVEHDAGRVSRFSAGGEKKGALAEGLKSPAFALLKNDVLFVSERKGNSVARIAADGALSRLNGEIIDPLGLAQDPKAANFLLVVSHRTSQVRRFTLNSTGGTLQTEPVVQPNEGAKYGWRDISASPDGAFHVTDEVSNAILRRPAGGSLEPWAKSLSSPSGIFHSPSSEMFVTQEGNGGVARIGKDGHATTVAEGLGAARAGLFLDAKTMLITDRKGGVVWKVTLP